MNPGTRDIFVGQINVVEDASLSSSAFTSSIIFGILEVDDLALLKASSLAGTFDFLTEPSEDIY